MPSWSSQMAIATSTLLAVQPDASLKQARLAIEAGEKNLKQAAEHLATAQEAGASQRDMAEAVGKSAAWVNRLLKWRETGYQGDTPFGPESKAKRERERVQATEQANDIWEDDKDQSDEDSETGREKSGENEVDRVSAVRSGKDKGHKKSTARVSLDEDLREQLIEALEGLRSMSPNQRAKAALAVTRLRRESGLLWKDLIIPSRAVLKRAA